MTDQGGGQRHSKALDADLIPDPAERAKAEARNGLRQFDRAMEMLEYWLAPPERTFRLRLSTILDLHRVALEGISAYAGNFRPAGVKIEGSRHEPVGAHLVPERIEEMCDYVNDNFQTKSAIHLAAYIMWRLNWIHPFADGNGRTSRTLSYLVMCIRLRERLPGSRTIPEQIVKNRAPYFEALDAADEAAREGRIDVGKMEVLLESLLAAQLLSVVERAASSQKTGEATPASLH
jgi:Fic family protein